MSDNLNDLLNGPAGPPPPGVVPQLNSPPNNRAATLFLCIFSIVLTTLIISMQLYTRAFITRTFSFPEWALFIGYGLYMTLCAVAIAAIAIAPGLHTWDLRLKHLSSFLYLYHVNAIIYGFIIVAIKLSIMAQFFPVFMPFKEPKMLYWTTILFMILNTVVYIVLQALEVWACHPVRKAWDPFVKGGHCVNVPTLSVGAAVINVATDTGIFLLPQASIWRLRMPFKKKVAYASVFFVAILSITAAAARLHVTVTNLDSTDVVWTDWVLGVTALVEIDFAFLCACMPAIPAFVTWTTKNRPYLLIASYWRSFRSQATSGDRKEPSGLLLQDQGHIHNPHTKPTVAGFYTRAYGSSTGGSDAVIEDSTTCRNA